MAFIFPNSWDDDIIWLIFFKGGWNHQLDKGYIRVNDGDNGLHDENLDLMFS